MTTITVHELLDVTRAVVGDDDELTIDAAIIDVPFEQLNFDSLHIMAVSTRLEQQHGFKFPEEPDYARVTPRQLIAIANEAIAAGQGRESS